MWRFLQLLYFKLRQKILQGKVIKNSHVDKTATIAGGSQFINSTIGRHSFAGYNCLINNCEIGNFCSIAAEVIIGAAEHPIERASSSSAFEGIANSLPHTRFAAFPPLHDKQTTIGSDVWIGQRAIIKGGVSIGHGAVIGAGAVVTKNVAPYAIVAGCPAKLIRYRFNEDTRQMLLNSKWWDLPDSKIHAIAPTLCDPIQFAQTAGQQH